MTVTDTYTITYTARTITYTLNGTDATTGLTIRYLGDQGFGLAPLHRITTRGPLQDGDSDIDFRLDPRVLQLPLMVVNTSNAPRFQHYLIRESLLGIFRPGDNGTLIVRASKIEGVIVSVIERRINVRVLGGLSFDVDPNGFHVRTVVQLRADDPTWYETESGTSNRISTTYNDTLINSSRVFNNFGNWKTFPLIRINGPITNPTITNVTTGQVIAITATIAAGAYYDINLEYGKKTVVDNLGVNRISTVSASSNLATWAFEPGANTVAITGTGFTSASDIIFERYYRHTGI
jgi:hypothetical protein